MLLLSRVLRHEGDCTVCEVGITGPTPMGDSDEPVPPWWGIEYMAQCVAAHAGLVGWASGQPPRVGFLIGSRRVVFHTTGFAQGQSLVVQARRLWSGAGGMAAFECSVEDAASGAALVVGRLNCFSPDVAAGDGDLR
jgi:predicted hotdog family 3-hydroxylacyl-ACP dehydratase